MLSIGLFLAVGGLTMAKCPPVAQGLVCTAILAVYFVCCGVVYKEMKQMDYKTEGDFATAVYTVWLMYSPVSVHMYVCGKCCS
jgi:hypothetical protein